VAYNPLGFYVHCFFLIKTQQRPGKHPDVAPLFSSVGGEDYFKKKSPIYLHISATLSIFVGY